MKNKARSLLNDFFQNIDVQALEDVLSIQCGFTEEEVNSWISEAMLELDCEMSYWGYFQPKTTIISNEVPSEN